VLQERSFWIAFNHVRGIGPIRFQKLLKRFGCAEEAWYAGESALREVVGERVATLLIESRRKIKPERLEETIERARLRVLTLLDDTYPPLLREITAPPFLLYLKGDFDFLRSPRYLAMVGTRRPTPYGIKAARYLAGDLSEEFVIVSGMALGIDGEVHKAVVERGGITIGVLGNGLPDVYPRSHRRLAEEVVARGGALLSEYPPFSPPLRENFPPRNRIISGLSQGVVVVEASSRSGALITANFALEEGREVMAVPGSIFSAQSEGTNRLIAQGAKPVQKKSDVLEALGMTSGEKQEERDELQKSLPLNEAEKELLSLLDEEGRFQEELLALTGWEERDFFTTLFSLEMKGLVRGTWGGKVIRL